MKEKEHQRLLIVPHATIHLTIADEPVDEQEWEAFCRWVADALMESARGQQE